MRNASKIAEASSAGTRAAKHHADLSDTWQEHVTWVVQRLVAQYGCPGLGNRRDPTDELFYILLSKKSRPDRYQSVLEQMLEEFKPWQKLLRCKLDKIARVLRPAGLASVRAAQFRAIARLLVRDRGTVSLSHLRKLSLEEARAYLLKLPGVGEKSARCILMYSLDHDISPVDAHVHRILTRIGLLPLRYSVAQAHSILDRRMLSGLARSLHVTVLSHGRAVCTSQKPGCDSCVIAARCQRQGLPPRERCS
jgi:endonuclease-3